MARGQPGHQKYHPTKCKYCTVLQIYIQKYAKKNNTFWLILKVHCKFFTIHCNRVNISFCTNLVKIWSSVQRFYLDKQFSFFCFSKLHILSMAQNNSICFNNQPIILLVAIFFFSRSYYMKVSRKFNQNKIETIGYISYAIKKLAFPNF